jgi:hypothetical protein
MGTSLSGLTPATTFDGLLKTSDNEPLDATLKTIGTGDGTDSQLKIGANGTQLGNIAFVSSNVITTASPSTNLRITSGGVGINGDYSFPTANTRLHIKGSGATSATTSLLVQNSAGSDLLKVTDDGAIDFGVLGLDFSNDGSGGTMSVASDRYVKLATGLNTYSALGAHIFKTLDGSAYSEAMRITGNPDQFVGIGESTPTARLHVKGSGNDNTTTSLLVQNSDGDELMKVTDDSDVTLSKLVTIRNSSAGLFARAYADGYGAGGPLMWVNGSMNLGSSPSTAAKLSVKGSGATSATTALLVQNSAGTDLLKVSDNGVITTSGTLNAGTFYVPASGSALGSVYARINNTYLRAGSQGINISASNTTPDASAQLQVDSTTQGFLPPRMTTTQRDAISTPAAGLMVYNTTTNKAQCYNGTTWNDLF